MRRCIVRNGNRFEVVEHEAGKSTPTNHVISPKEFNTGFSNQFQLAENDIRIVWMNGSRDGHHVRFLLNGIELFKIVSPQIQSVCDYLNKYSSLSKLDLNKLVMNVKQNKKTSMEEDLEELEIQRDLLKNEISELKLVLKKKDEIFVELDQLIKQNTNS